MLDVRIKENNNVTYRDSFFWVGCHWRFAFSVNSNLYNLPQLIEIPQSYHFTKEERACEQHFQQATTRNEDGLLIVKLPFRKTSYPMVTVFSKRNVAANTFLPLLQKREPLYQKRSFHQKCFGSRTHGENPEVQIPNRIQQVILPATPLNP